VRFTVAIAVYVQTPRTILSFSGPFDADGSCESAHDDKQQPHGRLPVARSYERPHLLFIPSLCTLGAADRGERQAAGASALNTTVASCSRTSSRRWCNTPR